MKSNKTEQSKVVNPRAAWAAQRINILNERLGDGVGATRERARLNKIIGGAK